MHRLMISCHVRSVIPSQRGLMLMKALSKIFFCLIAGAIYKSRRFSLYVVIFDSFVLLFR